MLPQLLASNITGISPFRLLVFLPLGYFQLLDDLLWRLFVHVLIPDTHGR